MDYPLLGDIAVVSHTIVTMSQWKTLLRGTQIDTLKCLKWLIVMHGKKNLLGPIVTNLTVQVCAFRTRIRQLKCAELSFIDKLILLISTSYNEFYAQVMCVLEENIICHYRIHG